MKLCNININTPSRSTGDVNIYLYYNTSNITQNSCPTFLLRRNT